MSQWPRLPRLRLAAWQSRLRQGPEVRERFLEEVSQQLPEAPCEILRVVVSNRR